MDLDFMDLDAWTKRKDVQLELSIDVVVIVIVIVIVIVKFFINDMQAEVKGGSQTPNL